MTWLRHAAELAGACKLPAGLGRWLDLAGLGKTSSSAPVLPAGLAAPLRRATGLGGASNSGSGAACDDGTVLARWTLGLRVVLLCTEPDSKVVHSLGGASSIVSGGVTSLEFAPEEGRGKSRVPPLSASKCKSDEARLALSLLRSSRPEAENEETLVAEDTLPRAWNLSRSSAVERVREHREALRGGAASGLGSCRWGIGGPRDWLRLLVELRSPLVQERSPADDILWCLQATSDAPEARLSKVGSGARPGD